LNVPSGVFDYSYFIKKPISCSLKILLLLFPLLAFSCVLTHAFAEKINSEAYLSIVEALQYQAKKTAPVFPLEAYDGGIQSIVQGLRYSYFGYGERRYPERSDFHPAIDLAYFPAEVGNVVNEAGESTEVRALQTYLKKVYAIHSGELVSIALTGSGYKLILKHTLEKPYFDNEGLAYSHYYTCYRHLDSRSLGYLDEMAKKTTGNPEAGYEDLFGQYVFEAGEQIALVGFNPNVTTEIPRVHLDFSLNMYKDPNKGKSIRKYALNPLLLFHPLSYADPHSYEIKDDGLPSYEITIDESTLLLPTRDTDGHVTLNIHSGGWLNDVYTVIRYFALNGLDAVLYNDGRYLNAHRVDRHRKLAYDVGTFLLLDEPDRAAPHFYSPLGDQVDVFKMNIVLPKFWLEESGYDWMKGGSLAINISSIWKGYLKGHSHSFAIPLPESSLKSNSISVENEKVR